VVVGSGGGIGRAGAGNRCPLVVDLSLWIAVRGLPLAAVNESTWGGARVVEWGRLLSG
jgi:hypothetical protein